MARLISIADVKPLLSIRENNTAYDQRITDSIAAASKLIESECRQSFTRAERTELHNARESYMRGIDLYGDDWGTNNASHTVTSEQVLPLSGMNIDAEQPVTVRYDPHRLFGDETVLPQEYYFLDTDLRRVLLTYPTRQGRSTLKVTYTAGYAIGDDETLSAALGDLAPDLKRAAILTAIHLWNRVMPDTAGSTGDGDKNKAKPNSYGLPMEAMPLLLDYRGVLTGRG